MKYMQISKDGLLLIKKYEGCRLEAYKCPAGVWTIGYGHTRGVTEGMTITQTIADRLLKEDIAPIEKLLNGMKINFRQGQFDALCSWIFNLGSGNFQNSTMRRRIVEGAPDSVIVTEMKKWTRAGGKVLQGLVRRRAEEAAHWMM